MSQTLYYSVPSVDVRDIFSVQVRDEFDLQEQPEREAAFEVAADDYWNNRGCSAQTWPLEFSFHRDDVSAAVLTMVVEVEPYPKFLVYDKEKKGRITL